MTLPQSEPSSGRELWVPTLAWWNTGSPLIEGQLSNQGPEFPVITAPSWVSELPPELPVATWTGSCGRQETEGRKQGAGGGRREAGHQSGSRLSQAWQDSVWGNFLRLAWCWKWMHPSSRQAPQSFLVAKGAELEYGHMGVCMNMDPSNTYTLTFPYPHRALSCTTLASLVFTLQSGSSWSCVCWPVST